MVKRGSQISQKSSAHRPMASGAAITKPRAKLPLRVASVRKPRDLTGAEASFAITALSIMVIDLLLLAEKSQRALLPIRRLLSNPLAGAGFPAAVRYLAHLWRELEDLAFILRLLVEPKPKCRRTLHRAITQRTHSRRSAARR